MESFMPVLLPLRLLAGCCCCCYYRFFLAARLGGATTTRDCEGKLDWNDDALPDEFGSKLFTLAPCIYCCS